MGDKLLFKNLRLLEYDVSGMFGGLALCSGKSKGTQVDTGKQRFSAAKQDGRNCEMQGIDRAGLQILPHGGDAATILTSLSPAACLA